MEGAYFDASKLSVDGIPVDGIFNTNFTFKDFVIEGFPRELQN